MSPTPGAPGNDGCGERLRKPNPSTLPHPTPGVVGWWGVGVECILPPVLWPWQKPQEFPDNSHLEERIERVERKLRDLDLEFTNLYDKVQRAMHRIVKRAAVADPDRSGDVEPVKEPHDDWQRKILERRGQRAVRQP